MKSRVSKLCLVLISMMLVAVSAFAQKKTVTGTVVDTYGEPVIGANVVESSTNGTITDVNGKFSLQNVAENAVLRVSFIGYATQEVPVAGKSQISVTLQEEGEDLDEVVVVGYGVQKKRDLTGSVASIKQSDIQSIASPNAMQAMQGKVPGIDIMQSSGQAGSGVNISVRGNRSITASNSPLIIVDGVEYGSTVDIPTNDIESMDILKDAASTAIYGTKGANGVIIITTKRGKSGKTAINVNSYWSFNSPTSAVKSMYGTKEVQRWLDRANYTADLASGDWGSSDVSVADVFGSQSLDDGTLITDLIAEGSYTDWYDEILQKSTTQNYQVSVAGGSEKTNFNLAVEAMLDRGLLKNDEMNRYNGRVNIDHKINKIVKTGASLSFTFKDHDARNASIFNAARKMTSLTHVYNTDGSINETPNIWYTAHVNPLMDEGDNYQKNTQTIRFLGSGYIGADWNGLSVKSLFAVDRSNVRTGVYQDYKSVGRYQSPSTTAISNGTSQSTKITWQNTINYMKSFNEKHDLGFLLGHEMSQTVAEGLDLSGTAGKEHYYSGSFYDVSKITSDVQYSSDYTKQSMLSFFGRANYSYAGKYLFQATVRGDGSSVLADGHKWGAFPSASVGWRLSDEDWMESVRDNIALDNLKLRYSLGQSGNAAISPYQTLATVSSTTPNSATEFIPMSMSNPDLSWETTTSSNFGVDFAFFGNRINGSIDYYTTNTDDLLYYKTSPASSVYTSVLCNIGESKGHGIEISLGALAVKTKDFTWDINASYSHSEDEVVKLADGLERNISGTSGFIVGKPISLYFDYEAANCWNVGEFEQYLADNNLTNNYPANYGTPGTMKIIDRDMDGDLDEDDKRVYNRMPKHIFGMTNTFSYKNFALSVQMLARLGGYMAYDKNNALGLDDGDANWADVDYWTSSNTDCKIPNPGTNTTDLKTIYTTYKTALLYEKADFFKIKDITLSYNVEKQWLQKAHIANAKIYCSMKNYITFNKLDDDYDPERGGSISFPLAKQVVLGVNVSF